MRETAEKYYQTLRHLLTTIEVTDNQGERYDFYDGVARAGNVLLSLRSSGKKIMFIGNGASASISSHMAADFSKNGKIRAIAFNDIALLTALSNDLGYEHVFEIPVERFADEHDVLVAISSSGQSVNILKASEAAKTQGCHVITLSGFKDDNPLRSEGHLNFFVPSQNYGPVEVIHHAICHGILDTIMKVQHG
ncbi:MAG: SIS domain-containing protein [bacterium]|nr:SIS domain-containing protein [bacterium]